MAGGENERVVDGRTKAGHRIRSLLRMSKNKPTKTGEQSTSSGIQEAILPVRSSSAVPATDKADQQALVPVVGANVPSSAALEGVKNLPIRELWNEAYEALKHKEESLIKDYETAMAKDGGVVLGSISLALGAPQVAVGREKQMEVLVAKKVADAKKNAWKLKYGDSEVMLRDVAEPFVNLIKDAEGFVDGVVSANPYASIAWAGVSLLLPVSRRVQGQKCC